VKLGSRTSTPDRRRGRTPSSRAGGAGIDTVTFTGADFSIQHDGVCHMYPELARRVAQLAMERCQVISRKLSPVRAQGIRRQLTEQIAVGLSEQTKMRKPIVQRDTAY
jgi:hypothetical protein